MNNTKQKFKSNPYNKSNFLISQDEILNIFKFAGIQDITITNISLYQTAFIHKSYCHMKDYEEYENSDNCLKLQNESYEKMEFLGDSILGCIISEYIFKRYTLIYNQDEGFLTRIKNRLVNGETLAFLADKLNFNKYLIISNHIDINHDGRNNKNILEDSFEAFIGALYLDTYNIEFAKKFILNIFEKYIDFTDIIINNTNYKDQLQRYFQNNFKDRKNSHPKYIVEEDENNKIYICKVFLEETYIKSGKGETKKKAEQDAAKNTLKHYGVI
jgi:ribonuclease-3